LDHAIGQYLSGVTFCQRGRNGSRCELCGGGLDGVDPHKRQREQGADTADVVATPRRADRITACPRCDMKWLSAK
jgi:hypothetical protein